MSAPGGARPRAPAAAVAGAFLLASCSTPPAPELSEEEIRSIRAVHDSYPAAWLANDPERVMELFAEDAVLIPHHGASDVVGRSAIREFFFPESSPPVTVSEFEMSLREIDGRGDLAYARGRFSLGMQLAHEGEIKSYSNSGNYLMLLQKSPAGDWRIARYIWNDPAG